MSIDYQKSAELNNINIDKLKSYFNKYPKSHKLIIRICDNCGEERQIRFDAYYNLCNNCSKINIEFKEKQSKIMIQYYKDNLQFSKNHSDFMIEYYKNQDNRNNISNQLLEYHKNNPNAGIELGKKLKNSNTHKKSTEKFNGGNDLIKHHYIYDHSNLSKYTMLVTRSYHNTIHKWLRKSNIKIPHINMGV